MNARAVGIVMILAVLTPGCRDAAMQVKMRRQTIDLLRTLTDIDLQLNNEEDSLKYLSVLGKPAAEQAAIIDNARKRVAEVRAEIYKHSRYAKPIIDQIRYEELDHDRLFERVRKIRDDHGKGMKRAKEVTTAHNKI